MMKTNMVAEKLYLPATRRRTALILALCLMLGAAAWKGTPPGVPAGTSFVSGSRTSQYSPSCVWSLILVNRWNPLPEGYEETVPLIEYAEGKYFDKRAKEALDNLIKAGKPYNLSAQSLYRSIAQQAALFRRKTEYYTAMGFSEADAENLAANSVARPGTSEHNTGLAVDLLGDGYTSLEQSFANTECYRWLIGNCAAYGFILRYPEDKEAVTGVIFEPWHFRYVGIGYAAEIMESGLALEEYSPAL